MEVRGGKHGYSGGTGDADSGRNRKKALIVTRVSGFVPQFEAENVRILQEMGYEVHYASNFETVVYGKDNARVEAMGLICHHIPFERKLLCMANYRAYKQLKRLMERERFSLVHCHMPFTGVAARMAAAGTGTAPVLYTGHGFHFFTGAPWKNWIFYPIERWMARYTDCLITINAEDYRRAESFPVRGSVCRIHGVGIDCGRFAPESEDSRDGERMAMEPVETADSRDTGTAHDAGKKVFTVVTVGELAPGKNHRAVIRALPLVPGIRYEIYGEGACMDSLKELAVQCGVEDRVCFAGYCDDVAERLRRADAFVFPSLREGMPVAVMEAMAAGLPVIALNIRGCRELLADGEGGFLLETDAPEVLAEALERLRKDSLLTEQMGMYNISRIQEYDIKVVREEMRKIYEGLD